MRLEIIVEDMLLRPLKHCENEQLQLVLGDAF
jgi:hypothetical protein